MCLVGNSFLCGGCSQAVFANLSALALSSSLTISQNASQVRPASQQVGIGSKKSDPVEASESLSKMESLLLSLGRQPTTDSNMVEAGGGKVEDDGTLPNA